MSLLMPGWPIDCCFDFAVIAEVPWCAACRVERHVGLSERGMAMWFFYMTTHHLLHK